MIRTVQEGLLELIQDIKDNRPIRILTSKGTMLNLGEESRSILLAAAIEILKLTKKTKK